MIVTQTGCGSTLTPGTPDALRCSKFWVEFGKPDGTEYSQFNLENGVGDFHLSASVEDARKVLAADRFFELNPPAQQVPTDTALATVTVHRCATTVSLKIYSEPQASPSDAQTNRLLDDLRKLVRMSTEKRLDTNPHVPPDIDLWY
ncbi:MAG TPA: hypothetical protein VGG89_04455 [Candidatus Baltobacteraceae bacterium]